jgi:dihydroflavonol-4-reductase
VSTAAKLILVTGANGFVGSHLTEALLARDYRVRCMVRRSSDLTFVRDLPVEWMYADVRQTENLRECCRDVDAVCHCAALTRALDEETFMRVNTQGTAVLARVCVEVNPRLERFLFVSSQAAAGPSAAAGEYLDESCPPRPITWYGKSKWAAEQALGAMDGRLPLTIVRPSAVFGPREVDFFGYFELVRRGLDVQIGRHERLLSFIYVHDLIRAILLALESDAALGQTYFACGPAISHTELSATIARALGRQPLRITVPEAVLAPAALGARAWGRLTGKPALINDQRVRDLRQRYWLCSGEKARQELGFVAASDFEAAIQETADWYVAHGWL